MQTSPQLRPPAALHWLRWLLTLMMVWFLWASVILSETGTGPIVGMLYLLSWMLVGAAALVELTTFLIMVVQGGPVPHPRVYLMVYGIVAMLIALVL